MCIRDRPSRAPPAKPSKLTSVSTSPGMVPDLRGRASSRPLGTVYLAPERPGGLDHRAFKRRSLRGRAPLWTARNG
eukprot:9801709-Alexandrium_andersonii.AAC.1